MTKHVQNQRYSTAIENTLVDRQGVIHIVTDTNEIRTHDGVTAGGNKILTDAQNQTIYQALVGPYNISAGTISNVALTVTGATLGTVNITGASTATLANANITSVTISSGVVDNVSLSVTGSTLAAPTVSSILVNGVTNSSGIPTPTASDQFANKYYVDQTAFSAALPNQIGAVLDSGLITTGGTSGGAYWHPVLPQYFSGAGTLSERTFNILDSSNGPYSVTMPANPNQRSFLELMDPNGSWFTNNVTLVAQAGQSIGTPNVTPVTSLALNISDLIIRLMWNNSKSYWEFV